MAMPEFRTRHVRSVHKSNNNNSSSSKQANKELQSTCRSIRQEENRIVL